MQRAPFAISVIAALVSFAAVAGAQAGARPAPAAPPPAPSPAPAPPATAAPPSADKAPDGGAPPAAAPAQPPAEDTEALPPAAGTDADGDAPTAGPEAAPRRRLGAPSAPAAGAAGAGAAGMTGLGDMWGASSSGDAAKPAPEVDKQPEERVLAEDWWSHARPAFEIHGYFRTRGELFHNFNLGRGDDAIWPPPLDKGAALCTADESGAGSNDSAANPLRNCGNNSQAGANMRFRLDPELHISDNLRVVSQIDLLDNATLGATPSGYQLRNAGTGGYAVSPRSGYEQGGVFDDTIVPPQSGVNGLSDSIRVKRAWAEYTTPVGQLRFGRMPNHFGLGMLYNSGDGYDDDYQSTIDRLQFITAIKPLDLYVGASWDFPNEGPYRNRTLGNAPAYDLAQLDDVDQWSLLVMRKQSPELMKNSLSRGQLVVNGGAYITLRKQLLHADSTDASQNPNTPDVNPAPEDGVTGFGRRAATIWVPDFWLELRYRKFRFGAEAAGVIGSIENIESGAGQPPGEDGGISRKLRQYGLATQIEQKLVEDKLRLKFDFGWSSGDASAFNTNDNPNNLVPSGAQTQVNSDTISTFRFNPAYRIDLILFRNLLDRIQGAYYFKPSIEYDFMRKPSGQRLGGGAGVIWSRASEFVQSPGHARDLGIELNGRVYFQSKDGSLNDAPANRMGGFYAMLEYGVLFPLSGLGFPQDAGDTSAAQIMRLYLGAVF